MDTVKKTKLSLHARLSHIGIRYWTLVCLLSSVDILGPLATDGHLPSLPAMTVDLSTSPSWIQFTILSYSFIMAVASLLGGILSDIYGRRNMTIFGLFVFVCGGYGCTFAPNIEILNICRLIQGIGGGISSIITSSVARDVFLANERMKILGILGSIRPIGIAISPMFGGWIAALFGWRMVFFVISSFAAIITVLSFWLLPETKNKFFVNYNKIRLIKTETNVVGNIGIVADESNFNLERIDTQTNKASTPGNTGIVTVLYDSSSSSSEALESDDQQLDEQDADEWSAAIPMHPMQSLDSRNLVNFNNVNANQPAINHKFNYSQNHSVNPYDDNNNNKEAQTYDLFSPSNGQSAPHDVNGKNQAKSTGSLPAALQSSDSDMFGTNLRYCNCRCCKLWKIACGDNILMTVSWIFAFRGVGVFVYLNEFPYVTDRVYHYGQQTSGLMIGVGSIFTILGASIAILSDRDRNDNKPDTANLPKAPSERSSLLFKLSKKNAKLSIMRMSCIISLICSALLILPPILAHYAKFLQVLEIDANIEHLELLKMIYTNNPWYFLVIPFCVLTFSQGLFIPPATVVVLEPYPHIAGSISAILQFWKIILPTLALILITQCLSYHTNHAAPVVIHGIVGFCSFMCFVLMYGCVSGHDVRLRMCGWQEHITNDNKLAMMHMATRTTMTNIHGMDRKYNSSEPGGHETKEYSVNSTYSTQQSATTNNNYKGGGVSVLQSVDASSIEYKGNNVYVGNYSMISPQPLHHPEQSADYESVPNQHVYTGDEQLPVYSPQYVPRMPTMQF